LRTISECVSLSKTLTQWVNPTSASRAVISPEWADRPAWNGVVIVPKLAMTPLLCDAASASALLACSASRWRSDAQAAAAPIGPKMPVGCQPLRWW
jgi:hypothetical protein